MARRKSSDEATRTARPARLARPKAEVERCISERIEAGRELQAIAIRNDQELEGARSKRTKWNDYNRDLLRSCFDSEAVAENYESVSILGPMYANSPLSQRVESFRAGIGKKITSLESLIERLDFFQGAVEPASYAEPAANVETKNAAFIVHGADESAKSRVARFIERLGVRAVVLHEQPNRGQTIIEKFEANAAEVGFAVVLLTADDIGGSKADQESLRPRARQNVLLELGYFTAALRRNRVCVLYENGVEIPSDYLGVVYTPLDAKGGWQLSLAREMKAAGLDVDLNHAI